MYCVRRQDFSWNFRYLEMIGLPEQHEPHPILFFTQILREQTGSIQSKWRYNCRFEEPLGEVKVNRKEMQDGVYGLEGTASGSTNLRGESRRHSTAFLMPESTVRNAGFGMGCISCCRTF